ncbi:MAG: carbohydrate kinase family protein [Candidatus Hodarchaeales archaeon]
MAYNIITSAGFLFIYLKYSSMFPFGFESLQEKVSALTMTVLPDFYLDVIVHPNMSYDKLIEGIDSVYQRGGGNLLGPKIQFVPGGNGGNVARAASALGASTYFVCKTSPLGKVLIEFYLNRLGVKTIINDTGDIASSVILEIPVNDQKHNVMLSSSGSVAQFSFSELSDRQQAVLKESDVIAITNAQNLKMEDLVEGILNIVDSDTFLSLDFSDLTPHKHRLKSIRKRILNSSIKTPSMISGNENEFQLLAGLESIPPSEAAEFLSEEYNSIIFGLHQATHSEIWLNGNQLANEKCYRINVLRATGAGDTWHAGFVIALKSGLNFEKATKFANATAAHQISTGRVGSLKDIYNFVSEAKTY